MTIVFDSPKLAELYLNGNNAHNNAQQKEIAESYIEVVNGLNLCESINKFNINSKVCLDVLSDENAVVSWTASQLQCNIKLRLVCTQFYPERYDCHIAEFSTSKV